MEEIVIYDRERDFSWQGPDLNGCARNSGPWALMDSPLLFLMKHRCLLDPAGNPFRFDAVYGVRGGGLSGMSAPSQKSPEWAGLAEFGENIGELPSFDNHPLCPLENSPYRNTGKRKIGNSLDKARLKKALLRQLGCRLSFSQSVSDSLFELYAGWRELPFRDGIWKAGLFGALFLCGYSDDRRMLAFKMLESLNRTWCKDRTLITKEKMDMGISEREEDDLRACLITAHHIDGSEFLRSGFANPLFMRLLEWGRKRGPVPSWIFAWIRYFDRPLWYALSQTGRRAASAEAAGSWAHLLAEKSVGRPLEKGIVEPAISAFEKEMTREGWLHE